MTNPDAPAAPKHRSWWKTTIHVVNHPLMRLAIFLIFIAILTTIVRGNMDFVSQAINNVRRSNPAWTLAGTISIAISMLAMGEMMFVLLSSAGVTCRRKDTYALTLTSNSVSSTFPGGAAISMAMVFREQHRWGASSVIASWYMVVSGVVASAVLATYGLVAFYFLGANVSPWTLILSLFVLAAVLFAFKWLAAHLDWVESRVLRAIRWFNAKTGNDADRGIAKASESIETLKSVDLPPTRLLVAALWSAVNWGADCLCLMFCLWSVGAHPGVPSIILAFVTAKIVGTAQVTPGGLGPVEAAIIGTLVATGLSSASALAGTIIFRVLSFFLLAAVGWIVFLVQYAGPKRAQALSKSRESEAWEG